MPRHWATMARSPIDFVTSAILQGALLLARAREGNVAAIAAAALIPLVMIVGSSVDMARGYMAESRLQQACDAGTLAARKFLGTDVTVADTLSGDARRVGDRFFELNFEKGIYGTKGSRFTMKLEDDLSVSGEATVNVPVSIMGAFGFDKIEAKVNCAAQINFSDADIMFVIDTTTSMQATNPGDSDTRIDVLRGMLKNFYVELEANRSPETTVRYGFVPYSTNVNVGPLLESEWMVDEWTYQTKLAKDSGLDETREIPANYSIRITNGGGSSASIDSFVSDTCPEDTVVTVRGDQVEVAADPHEYYIPETKDGIDYYCRETDGYFLVSGTEYFNLERRWVYKYEDARLITYDITYYDYLPQTFDVSSMKGAASGYVESNFNSFSYLSQAQYDGCIEERQTYEIDDYTNVDLSRALDLDIDRVPTDGNSATQWRPLIGRISYARGINWGATGAFSVAPIIDTTTSYLRPYDIPGLAACPTQARKMAEMTQDDFDTYVDSLAMNGQTYHDIGMIWGARLISPTGLFAAENASTGASEKKRHLIFLTDGTTEGYDISYGPYGLEPLDQRRWSNTSTMSLDETIENRFAFACNEIKKRNVTVWVIGFGTALSSVMVDCAGPGRSFEAANAIALRQAFATILASAGELRITN